MCCFVILLLSNEMQMSVRRFSAIPHLRGKNIPDLDAESVVFFLFASKICFFIVCLHPPSLTHVEFIPSLAFSNRTIGI